LLALNAIAFSAIEQHKRVSWEDDMLRKYESARARLGENLGAGALTAGTVFMLAAALFFATGTGAQAAEKGEPPVLFQEAVSIPVAAANTTGGLYAFDIGWVDQTTQTYYLADRSNFAIDVVNAKTDTFVKQISAIPPFAGATANPETSGPNGVLTARDCIIATDAPQRVVSFTAAGAQVTDLRISLAVGRADELAFDPKDNLLLVITPVPNGSSNPPAPFGTLISVASNCALTLGSNIPLPFATSGAEQPVWDPGTQRFFLSIPSTTPATQGALVSINPLTAMVDANYPVFSCEPAGLALNPTNNTLLLGCSVVFDTMGGVWSGSDANTAAPIQEIFDTDGFLQAIVPGVGSADEVWYNSGDDHFYTGSFGSPLAPHNVTSTTAPYQGAAELGVIDGTSQRLDQLVPTFNVPATSTHPAGFAHSVAANSANNRVFVPLGANNVFPGCLTGCVAVYSRSDVDLTGAMD
jgi:hypothetical protein